MAIPWLPVALLLIFLLLYLSFKSTRLALLVYTGVPFAVVGGVTFLWARGLPFSISAGVGYRSPAWPS
ncbi:MAG: efflux RND transporter permease subunit [Phycisphaeraceae bacterium]|nr:efflux RND transporter permease subunit [Phycisphaeraceae bacterium]